MSNLDQVLLRANKTGVKEVGLFRRDTKDLGEKTSAGYTIRNTNSRFSAGWDFIQVRVSGLASVCLTSVHDFCVGCCMMHWVDDVGGATFVCMRVRAVSDG